MFGLKKKKVLRAVWENQKGMRYTPRHYGDGGYSWKVWDNKEMRWVKDRELRSIDPEEAL